MIATNQVAKVSRVMQTDCFNTLSASFEQYTLCVSTLALQDAVWHLLRTNYWKLWGSSNLKAKLANYSGSKLELLTVAPVAGELFQICGELYSGHVRACRPDTPLLFSLS